MARIFVDLLSLTGTKGGMETYARQLYAELGRLAPEHEYLGYFSKEGWELDRSWFPGECIPSGISGENRFTWAWGELRAVARAARRREADLIHSPATLGPPRSTMPTVVTMHDMLYWSHPEFMSTPLYTTPVKWMERLVSRNAARVITDSPGSAGEIVKYLALDPATVDVVPLAGGHPEGVDRSLANSEGSVILAMGNRRPHKNWASIVRALALIPADRRPRAVITGGRGPDPLESIVEELELSDWVELRQWVDDDEVARLYSIATALVIPSLAEGFSLPALEAMSAGVPVLLSDIDVHRYVGGDAARYFAPSDDQQLAAAIETLVADRSLQQKMAAAGREQERLFTWERTARETLAVFESVLSER